jgi:hypothetical protein
MVEKLVPSNGHSDLIPLRSWVGSRRNARTTPLNVIRPIVVRVIGAIQIIRLDLRMCVTYSVLAPCIVETVLCLFERMDNDTVYGIDRQMERRKCDFVTHISIWGSKWQSIIKNARRTWYNYPYHLTSIVVGWNDAEEAADCAWSFCCTVSSRCSNIILWWCIWPSSVSTAFPSRTT